MVGFIKRADGQGEFITDLLGDKVAPSTSSNVVLSQTAFLRPSDKPSWDIPTYRSIAQSQRIAVDIETVDPDLIKSGPAVYRNEGKIVGVAIAYSETDASYYPVAHNDKSLENVELFWDTLRKEALEYTGELVGCNLIYDLDWLNARHNIVFPRAKILDIQIAEPLLDELRSRYGLKYLATDYLGEQKLGDELTKLYGKKYITNMDKVYAGHAAMYAEQDALLSWKIFDKQTPKLKSQGLSDLYELEADLMHLLLDMRKTGVRVDVKKAQFAKDKLEQSYSHIAQELSTLAGVKVSIYSAASIARLFDKIGLNYPVSKTGKPSFTKQWLANHEHEVAQKIVMAREADKTVNTFLKSYILEKNQNGRIHSQFHPLKGDDSGTVSGRFSSSNPNLQNIMARHPIYGPLVRSMFIPEEGYKWGCLDWSQIEYRLLVHFASLVPNLDTESAVKAYRENPNTDFHQMAAEMTGVDRKYAKGINFGVVYGMGKKSLALMLGVGDKEASNIMENFHSRAPFMRGMLQIATRRVEKTGQVKTLLGRIRRFRGIAEGGKMKYFNAYSGLNAVMQGSAADIMKKAMVDANKAGVFSTLVPHLTVHDELDFSVPNSKQGLEAFNDLKHIMQTTVELNVPLVADGGLGENWAEAK